MDNNVRLHHNRTTPTTINRLSMNTASDPRSPESIQLLDHELEIVRGDMVKIGSAMESSQAQLLKELSKAQEEIDRKSPPILRQELNGSDIESPLLISKSVYSRLEPGMIREMTHGRDSIHSSPLKGDYSHGTIVGGQALGHVDTLKHNFGTPFGNRSEKGEMISPASVYINPSVMKDEEDVIDYEGRSHEDLGRDRADVDSLRNSNRLHSSSKAIESRKVDGGSSDAINHYTSPYSKGLDKGTVDTDEDRRSTSSKLQSLLQDAYLELNAARAELAVSESCNDELKEKIVAHAQEMRSMLESMEAVKLELKSTHEMFQSNKKELQEVHGKAENAESRLVRYEGIGKLMGSNIFQTKYTLSSAFYSWSRTTVAMHASTKERELQVLPNNISGDCISAWHTRTGLKIFVGNLTDDNFFAISCTTPGST